MELPIRLENAITKLYNAFHNDELNAMDCEACAVGNICDNDNSWDDLPIYVSTVRFGNIFDEEFIEQNRENALKVIAKTGYAPEELQKVELLFVEACEYVKGNREQHFKGLCAVVEYLCELDNIPNVMDYTKLFETENDKPKYQLM